MIDWGDASRALFVWAALLVTAHGATTLVADKVGRLALWDERALERQRVDYSWELDLIQQAEDGRWSGVDFQHPRGPLFQLLVWLPSAAREGDVGWRIVGAEALVQAVCVTMAVILALVFVRGRWRRLLAVVLLSSLAFAAGVETIRALASVVVVLLYGSLDTRYTRSPWRGPVLVAVAVAAAGLLSFERWALSWIAIAAMHGYEVIGLRLRGVSTDRAWRRLGRTVTAQAFVVLFLAAVLHAAGGAPSDYLLGSFRTGVSYASKRSIPWLSHGVGPEPVAAFVGLSVLVALGWAGGPARHRRLGKWIVGAASFALFAIFRPYPGQILLGLAPLAFALALIVAQNLRLGRATLAWRGWPVRAPGGGARAIAVRPGVVVVAALLAAFGSTWFGAYPETLWWRPRILQRGLAAWQGDLERDADYVTEIGNAARWLSAYGDGACFGVYPGATALYSMVDGDGPTQGRMRWVEGGPETIARAIRERRCPYHVQFLYSFDRGPAAGMAFGEDFLAVSELYGAHQRVGPSTWILALRDEPTPARRRPIDLEPKPTRRELSVGDRVRLALSEPIAGHELLAIDHRLELTSPLPPPFVNTPRLRVRFLHEGAPVGEWQPVYVRTVGASARLYASPDPEAAENRFLLDRPLLREVVADAVELELAGAGWRTAPGARLSIEGAHVLTHPRVEAPANALVCDRRRALLDDLRANRALVRNVGVGPLEDRFDLHANPPLSAPPEVFFEVQPCPGTCLAAELSVHAPPDAPESDGLTWEIHVIERENRALIHSEPMMPGQSSSVRLPLAEWDRRSVHLRFSTTSGEHAAGDFARVSAPRLVPCEEPADAFLDPLVFERAAAERERGAASEMALAAGWMRRLFEAQPDACVAMRPGEHALAKLHDLVGGLDLVTFGPEGLRRLGHTGELECEHLIYDAGSFDTPWRAAQLLGPDWRSLFATYAPEGRLSPRAWLLRRRAMPIAMPPQPIQLRAGSDGRVALSPSVVSDRALSVSYRLRCEEPPAEPTVVLRFFHDEQEVGRESPLRLRPDGEGRGRLTVSPDVATLERRWAGGVHVEAPPVTAMAATAPAGCQLEWTEMEAFAAPSPADDAPPAECDETRNVIAAVEANEAWIRATRPALEAGSMVLTSNRTEHGLAELFVPFVPCPGACLTVEVEPRGFHEGTVDFEAHLVAGDERPRVVHEVLSPETPTVTRTVPLEPWAGRSTMLRLGVTSRDAEPAQVVVRRARVDACGAEGEDR